ncbi:MAG: ABC transporter permease, partial [Acetobacteraceae bacterium]
MSETTDTTPARRFALGADGRRVTFAILAAAALFVIGDLVHPGFAGAASIKAVALNASFVGLVAAGQCFVVLVGGIDLSIPWVLNGAAILLVTASLGQDARAGFAVALTLGMGALVGFVNGVGTAVLAVPAVVMTLAMNGVMEGLTLGLSGGLTCGACASYAPPVVRAAVNGGLLGLPAALWVWLFIIVAVTFVLGFTGFGRKTYAIGNNALASRLAGVNVRAITIVL